MLLRIRDWAKHFETSESRKLQRMVWVPVPNKTDGEGYAALVDHPNGAAHLGAWYAILETASRQMPRERRGDFPSGIPQNISGVCRSLGRLSHLPASVFEEVIPRLLEIGWIEPAESASVPAESASVPAESASVPARVGRKPAVHQQLHIQVQEQLHSGVSSSSSKEIKSSLDFKKPDDDEKPKLEKQEYASARDELKAIHHAKSGEYPTSQFLDRIEGILSAQAETFDAYLDVLRPHLGNTWTNPGGFLTHLAKTGFSAQSGPPQAKPKPKCPTCFADNHRGAILQDGAIVPCPDCSTGTEWCEHLAAKAKQIAQPQNGRH